MKVKKCDLMKMNSTSYIRKHKNWSKTLIMIQLKSFFSQLAIDPLLPKNDDKTLQNPNWFEAIKNEYNSLVENNVWSLMKSDEKPVGSTWHSGRKFGPDGDICRYIARFVAKGFNQVFGKEFLTKPTHLLLDFQPLDF